ncbi:flagellar motor protein MotB [Aliarcobacter cryaerophilus ATCC 43158]|uniref:Flagellar motor stator protein n=1 Tax=Aliarcobacter cryaerophilus ATCC 43158 TaxID=1032070 RepID=A0AAD0TSC5_9BACT|nr:flagellar motor protein MotB [Aliarcobacter cryaerophilus]AYJ79559.1 flagellar motor stator protein [Aliarcobacter cryaerophilus ATCC 43158]PRM97008.1 flagellar motor protein MotB [Aliarcobacter cryaerophilus]QCZ23806.1 flagellar motor protein MotB [Aliarcobacter cryaerophilus ATCC 43158]
MSKKKKCECPAGEKWAVPYADFLSLLLALFIALYALASVNIEKQKALKEEFIKIYKFPSANIVEEQTKQEKAMTDEPIDDNVEGKKVIVHTLENKEEQEQNKNKGANLIELPNGSLMSVPAHLAFESGKSEITSVFANDFLSNLAQLINAMPEETEINVKGYAQESEVKNSKHKDALELSTARANNVIRELVKYNVKPSRLYSSGFGSNKESTLKDKSVVVFELHSNGEIASEEDLNLETIFNRMKE